MAGAGAGSGLIILAQNLGLNDKLTLILECAAPWVTVVLALIGPSVARFMISHARYWGLRYTLRQLRKLASESEDGSQSRARANANIAEVEAMLRDLMMDMAIMFRSKKDRGEQPREVDANDLPTATRPGETRPTA